VTAGKTGCERAPPRRSRTWRAARKLGIRSQIFHAHIKEVYWSPVPKKSGVFGGHLTFGDPRRYRDFRSVGRGSIKFEEIMCAVKDISCTGPLSVERDDGKMEREHGARESSAYLRRMDFAPTWADFEGVFAAEH
jgi:sugar phosphate isomerase/epimerase